MYTAVLDMGSTGTPMFSPTSPVPLISLVEVPLRAPPSFLSARQVTRTTLAMLHRLTLQ